MKPAIRALLLVPSIISIIAILENMSLRKTLERADAGYAELMQKQVNGKTIGAVMVENTTGIFKIGPSIVACAVLSESVSPGEPPRLYATRATGRVLSWLQKKSK